MPWSTVQILELQNNHGPDHERSQFIEQHKESHRDCPADK